MLVNPLWITNGTGILTSKHTATGGATVDTIPPTITAILPNTLNSAANNYNAITTPSNLNTAVVNTMLVDSSTSTGDTYAGQDGLVQIKSGNTSNYTGAMYGDVGSLYHYGSGTVTSGVGILGQVRLDGPGAYTSAAGVYGLALHTGSGTIGSVGTLYARNITWIGSTPTITNQYGLQVDSPVKLGGTITNNYGVYIADQGSVATNNYNLYSAGATAVNYFEGGLQADKQITLYPTNKTITAQEYLIRSSGTYTLDYTNAVGPVALSASGTFVFKQNGYGFGSGVLFQNATTYKNDSGTTRTIGPVSALAHAPTIQSNGGTLTLSYDVGLLQSSTYNVTNSGTTNVTNAMGAWLQGATVGTGTTVTNSYGILADYIQTVSGTLTNYAAFVSSTMAGTNQTRILLGTSTIPSGTWGIYQASTETNMLSGDLQFVKEAARTIQIQDTTTAATAGATLTILGAKGSNTTSGGGGAINVTGGDGRQGNSAGGTITLTGGAGVGVSVGGSVTLVGGAGLTGGTINIDAGSGVANGTVKIGVTRGDVYISKTGGKFAAFGATPVVQPATTGTTTGFTAGAGTAVNDASTFTGGTGSTAYRISDIVLALKQLGLLAA